MKKTLIATLIIILSVFSIPVLADNTSQTTTTHPEPIVIAKRGCCSHHGGVCGCSGGMQQCCDGTISPSCTCGE